ncbi:Hybrid signal transduction protein dokA [Neolecta irregularis DAH-3]|uniref:histidine kinase n=1 Tax=Neolecta irregularis (strain DAH-3) TaxID=1198029 RepID=A0A1U7LTQ9_NEOID|nr:Hybrid signal transduction protein dokA [Neolecta irregularis DAH-3]|eukprot:OLL25998.1 Hybrid signal transduction protein dokA [Neolecta irregularis DAH-3]
MQSAVAEDNLTDAAADIFLARYAAGDIDHPGTRPPPALGDAVNFQSPYGPSDAARLKALYRYDLLGHLARSPPVVPALDLQRFSRLASIITGAQTVLVTFIDDAFVHVVEESGPLNLIGLALPRPLAICSHTILRQSDRMFAVRDLSQDWRFNNNPFVTGPTYIKFYCGVPLRTRDGHNIGTICALDTRPRDTPPSAEQGLRDLAHCIMCEIELRRDRRRLSVKSQMQNSISEFTRGFFNSTVRNKRASVSDCDCDYDEVDLRNLFQSASDLIRNTLEIDGVSFVDIESVDCPFSSPSSPSGENSTNGQLSTSSVDNLVPLPLLASSASDLDHASHGAWYCSIAASLLRLYPSGHVFDDGLPPELNGLVPESTQSVLLVPIYDHRHQPFAICCAWSCSTCSTFGDQEQGYLEAFSDQIISEVVKRRVIVADRAKAAFISNISHELRSPLHGILASAEFLSDTKMNLLQTGFVDTIDKCGRTLLDVINHVLDFSKLRHLANMKPHSDDASVLAIRENAVDLVEIVEQVAESCYAGYEFKGMQGLSDVLSMSENKREPLTVIIDVDYRPNGYVFPIQQGAFRRIIMNLVGNALKYTNRGFVRVFMSLNKQTASEQSNEGILKLVISDSGKGIASSFLKTNLFAPFMQENPLQVGAGLGLSIVKQLVESLDGEIDIQSELGDGTQATVLLPVKSSVNMDGLSLNESSFENPTIDILSLLNSSVPSFTAHIAPSDDQSEASLKLADSMRRYLIHWVGVNIVHDVEAADLIITDDSPHYLYEYLESTKTGKTVARPMIVLCSNVARYENMANQADLGRVIDFVSKPCGPSKLAKAIMFCLLNQEHNIAARSRNGSYPNVNVANGTVRFSPVIGGRRGSLETSMVYLQGLGMVASESTSSPSEPAPFIGGKRQKTSPNGINSLLSSAEPATVVDHLTSNLLAPAPSTVFSPTNSSYTNESPFTTSSSSTELSYLPRSSSESLGSIKKPYILFAEDNSINAMILITLMRKGKYPFVQAINGLEAVHAFITEPLGFDFILMDIQMPVMDGFQATAEIRKIESQRKNGKRSKIIALTGLAANEDRDRAFAAGVDDFLTKPVNMATLQRVVENRK